MKNIKHKTFAILCAVGLLLPTSIVTAKKSSDIEAQRYLSTFAAIVKELQTNYVDTIPVEKTIRRAIDAMLYSLDPYTEFYSESDREDLERLSTGEYGGVGSYITKRDSITEFSGPFEGSPAAKAGIRSGDRILRIDTASIIGKASDEVSAKLRGKPGTPVEITVSRPYVGPDSIITFSLIREKLQTPAVPYYGFIGADKNIGYLKLDQFIDKSADDVKEALESFKANPQLKGVVIDLISNGGGLVESAVQILGNFLPKGTEVLRIRGREKDDERIYKTTVKPIMENVPLVVLIDGGTASASEITAGALQDLDRAVLIGTQSFGKGLVQSTQPLPNSSYLKLTRAKYYIPSGRLIQALDYSHRNADGSVARTPDSLTNVFHTAAGREVRDGGGLRPDIAVEWIEPNRLIYKLVVDGWIFNYATKYAATHDSITAPEDFVITDAIYEDFKNSIDPERFKYDKVCEEAIKDLKKIVKTEGYLNDDTEAELDKLATMLQHNLQHDLDLKRPEIAQLLAEEIVARYYYEKGRQIQSMKANPAITKAIEILENPTEYKRLLSVEKKGK